MRETENKETTDIQQQQNREGGKSMHRHTENTPDQMKTIIFTK